MRSWCFDSQYSGGVYDREYGSSDIREVVYKIVGNGLFMDISTSLQVVADSGLTAKVQPGNCFINGAFGAVDTAESITFDASASGRYDIVVARFDLSLSYRSIRLAVVKGTEGSSSAPALTRTASIYDLQLAKVNIRAGATSVLQSDITDTRTDTTVCGVVNGVSSQAAALQTQINTLDTAKQDRTNNLSAEAALDDADAVPFYDASVSAHRKTLWSNIKSKLKTYFDTIYYGMSDKIVKNYITSFDPGVGGFIPIATISPNWIPSVIIITIKHVMQNSCGTVVLTRPTVNGSYDIQTPAFNSAGTAFIGVGWKTAESGSLDNPAAHSIGVWPNGTTVGVTYVTITAMR